MTVMPCGNCGKYVEDNILGTQCKHCGWKVGQGITITFIPSAASAGYDRIGELESELSLYKQALTKAVSLPKGVLPDSKQYYTWMNNGQCVVERRRS